MRQKTNNTYVDIKTYQDYAPRFVLKKCIGGIKMDFESMIQAYEEAVNKINEEKKEVLEENDK